MVLAVATTNKPLSPIDEDTLSDFYENPITYPIILLRRANAWLERIARNNSLVIPYLQWNTFQPWGSKRIYGEFTAIHLM